MQISGKAQDYAVVILTVLRHFEAEHPEWEIRHWHIEKQQEAYCSPPVVFGIWIEHHPIATPALTEKMEVH